MPCRPGISSMSLGRCYSGHPLSHKLAMASKYGLQGIEIFYEDLTDQAKSQKPTNLFPAARYVRSLCSSLNLEIICLQPFMHYEGLLDRARHNERIEEVKLWIEIAKVLGTDTIQVPSSFLSKNQISPDTNLMVSDLRELADLGLQHTPTIKFAYESLCWGTYVDKWEQCWSIVTLVDRPNFGICLDSFNILGRIYADPASPSGVNPNATQEVKDSMKRLTQQLKSHKDKIFFIQIVDAERLQEPLVQGHRFYKEEQPARMSWSRNCRLFYGERDQGGYLPVREVAEAIIKDIGYDGWVSMELFNRAMERTDEGVVEELASRAAKGWGRLVADLDLEVAVSLPVKRAGNVEKVGVQQNFDAVEVARL
ncbi:3-dehydroshikimate dehydratase [Lindgomyces ingoldianus]|uniref:3-dehydroshikimate dehydratase n=1 Tax=Lindgomyces ingoldianus TaxID=673940 RepID=A0ACB6R4V2_9PLEO|nr:3-dehydroshikimate dehydratase [Lindgomyces ingoldianus]KAF2473466.1 3-dehydroshikimate dehydratase [Lindgomyces ingoldianus]